MTSRHLVGTALAVFLPLLAAAQTEPATRRRRIEPRADEIIRQMSERLATQPLLAFEVLETFDEVPDGEPRRELSNVRRVVMRRPDRLAVDTTGDVINRSAWYDGSRITILDKDHNTYAQIEAPATIDQALDLVAEEYGVVVPFSDFLYADPYAVLAEGVTYGRYLGIHLAAGVACHHLVFSQEEIEWQLWVEAGDDPLPRRLVITYVHEPGEPQYGATISKWNLKPQLSDEVFRFDVPKGAERIEPARSGSVPKTGATSGSPAADEE